MSVRLARILLGTACVGGGIMLDARSTGIARGVVEVGREGVRWRWVGWMAFRLNLRVFWMVYGECE